jgi:rubrerythrin
MDHNDIAYSVIHQAACAEGFAFGLYSIYAQALRKSGQISAAMLFDELANNEKEHMEQWLKRIGKTGELPLMFSTAIKGEDNDANVMYQKMIDLEGKLPDEVVELARILQKIETHHREMLKALNYDYTVDHTEDKGVKKQLWICPHCGNIYESEEEIPDECPVCHHEKRDFICKETIVDSEV